MSTNFEGSNERSHQVIDTTISETSRFQEVLSTSKQLIGRAVLALGIATGAIAVETAVVEPPPAVADTGNYPDWNASCVANNEGTTQGTGEWCSGYRWGYYTRDSRGRIIGNTQNSSRGYGYRNCTDWVAFRIPQLVQKDIPWGWGNAGNWDSKAIGAGYTVDNTPEPGDIAVWDPTSRNSYGHVEVVESVNTNGTANTSGYNKHKDGNYDTQSNVSANHYIDLNGTGKGINGEDLGGSNGGASAGDNTVRRVIKLNQADGTNLVYWAKAGSVFESWWRPGGDGVHHVDLVDITQADIKDIAAELKPDGEHLVYTATTHTVWETWYYPGQGRHTAAIIHDDANIRKIQKTVGPDGSQQLYVMTDGGVDEYWWQPGGDIHKSRIYSLADPVDMQKVTEPDGTQELYVADKSYVYENWWRNGSDVHTGGQIMHIAQADITDIDFSEDRDGRHRLYAGREQSGVWEAAWYPGGGISSRQITGDNGVRRIEKYMDGTTHVVYVATAGGVFEYWWNPGSTTVHGGVITSQADIHDFDRATSTDGAQAVYTAANTKVFESYWFPGRDGVRTGAVG